MEVSWVAQAEKIVETAANIRVKNRKYLLTPKSAPYIFIGPAFVLILIFTVYPVIYSLFLSFQQVRGVEKSFVGFANYERLFHDPIFYKSLLNTFEILI